MTEEQLAILEYLNEHALGYENRRTSTEIRDTLNLESGGQTNEHVREQIRAMILEHQCCIGSGMWVDGYWIIQTEDELERVCQSLESRANSITDRANALRESWRLQNG
ncbi:hypothetical protein [Natronogracilivirga saccharolytica]|uniref:Uncharacterized protein n=1 Tax=Natronogracilivirga saccharolytica TaxID=2812953 RepID=A0A8J7SDD5_9BACT|nr:hypothetical protein [Natronogracilivirga saccharolytica]MBP3194006.1 hypothetical protein [Natronogracilivirga saccharolytica]